MTGYGTVVAGVYNSATGARAVDAAARLAARSQAELVLVAAHGSGYQAESGSTDESYAAAGSETARASLEWAQRRCAALGAARMRTAAVKGDPVEVLTRTSRDVGADMVLVGSYGLATVNGVVFGSVPDGVSREADCDVMVVHTTDDRVRRMVSPRFRRRPRGTGRPTVVVAVEDTARSYRAAEKAARLAVDHEADLVLMGAREPVDFHDERLVELALKNEVHIANDTFVVDRALRTCEQRAQRIGVQHIERLMVDGDPVARLLRLADDRSAELVVLGNHRVEGRMRSMVGSVSGYVARNTASSVLMVA